MAEPTKLTAWQTYEARKKEIVSQNLPADEYERKIKELVKGLGI